jgi:hypothetical protein
VQDFSNIIFCHPDRNAVEWKDLASSGQTMVWQDPSAALRKTEINYTASFFEIALLFIVKRFLIVIKQPMDFQAIVVEFSWEMFKQLKRP